MKKQCFIGLIFDEETDSRIRSIKENIRDKFGVKHSLKTKAHITLFEPVWIEDIDKFWEEAVKDIKDFGTLELKLLGINHFDHRVIYIEIENNIRLKRLYELVRKKESTNFVPHVTLVHRDISDFSALWSYLSEIKMFDGISADKIVLFVHNNGSWTENKIYMI